MADPSIDMRCCIHGYSFEEGSTEADDHDCMNAPDPVKWDREGPIA